MTTRYLRLPNMVRDFCAGHQTVDAAVSEHDRVIVDVRDNNGGERTPAAPVLVPGRPTDAPSGFNAAAYR